jgi:hypothetical protein
MGLQAVTDCDAPSCHELCMDAAEAAGFLGLQGLSTALSCVQHRVVAFL